MQIVFHVGMGKTGSTTIQSALHRETASLAKSGYCYLGQWLGMIQQEFDQFAGFQSFLLQSPDQLVKSAETLLAAANQIGATTGAHSFILSNEQYLENIPKLSEFFQIIASKVNLRVVIFVRPPASWLPSAYMQWGVTHKTNNGPVRPFAIKARELMRQYEFVRQWRELLGAMVTVRPYDDATDVVQCFADTLSLHLPSLPVRQQTRPPVAEAILRAACNTAQSKAVLPDLFNSIRAHYLPPGTPARVSQKFEQIFNLDALPEILTEHHDTLSYIERECGIRMTGPLPSMPQYDFSELADELLGTVISMVFGQAQEIRTLRAQLDRLERLQEQG